MNEQDKNAARKYAWDYFALHADHRLRFFNFFVIISGLSLGAFSAVKEIAPGTEIVAFLPLTLVFWAFVFWRLDERTRRLIRNAEEALKFLDKQWQLESATSGEPHCLSIFARDDFNMAKLQAKWWAKSIVPFSYTNSFRMVYIIVGSLGVAFAVWEACS